MKNFRQFEAGPDPFGRKFQVLFKWMQTAISLRHADTVDVKFFIWTEGEERQERIIALHHPELLALSRETGHAVTDPWCTKLAAQHLTHMIESGEDLERTLVTVTPQALRAAAGLTAVA